MNPPQLHACMMCRLYRGVHHAPPGPHQDPVPAPDLHLRPVHRGQGLCPEDVRTGNNRCRYFHNRNKYFSICRRDFSPSGKVFFPPFLWRLRKEPGSFSPLSSSRKSSCLVQTNLELWWVQSQVQCHDCVVLLCSDLLPGRPGLRGDRGHHRQPLRGGEGQDAVKQSAPVPGTLHMVTLQN